MTINLRDRVAELAAARDQWIAAEDDDELFDASERLKRALCSVETMFSSSREGGIEEAAWVVRQISELEAQIGRAGSAQALRIAAEKITELKAHDVSEIVWFENMLRTKP